MSKYSSKFDVYNALIDINEVTDFSKVHIYADDNPVELRIDSYKDLIPYFPCVPWGTTYDNGETNVFLNSKPYYRIEEEGLLKLVLKDMAMCYRYMKRKKIEITLDSFLSVYHDKYEWWHNDEITEILIAKLISAKGNVAKVDISKIHTPTGNRYRKQLYEHMIENGWNEYKARLWCNR